MAGGWRWVSAFLALFTAVLTVLCFCFGTFKSPACICKPLLSWSVLTIVPETYAPTLLRERAKLLSKVTGKYYRASVDAKKPLDVKVLVKTSLGRPWILLFREPIVLAISIYMSIIYGTLYMVSKSALGENDKWLMTC